MEILTRQDILKAILIRKLMAHANDPAATQSEHDAYAAKALLLLQHYRHGGDMRVT